MTVQIPTKGANTVLKIGTAGSETDISSYVKTSSSPLAVNEEDTTTYGNGGYVSSTPTVAGLKRPFECLWNPTLDGILAPLLFVEGKSCVWGPAGSTVGQPKESGTGYLSKYERKSDAKGIVSVSCEFTYSGAIAQGTF